MNVEIAIRDTNEAIDDLHRALRRFEQVAMPVTHRFSKGLYLRELFMPAGTIVIGKIHKTEHPYVMSKGRLRLWTPEGVKEVSAPCTGITKPGTRRVALVLEDTVFTTIHVTDETDVDKIEAQVIESHDVSEGPTISIDVVHQLVGNHSAEGLGQK